MGFCFFKQKTAYELRISDWSSDVCSSDLQMRRQGAAEIGRGIMKLGDDARTDVGDQAMLDLVQYALCIGGGEPVPVDRQLAQMRHRGARVEGNRKSTRLNSSH